MRNIVFSICRRHLFKFSTYQRVKRFCSLAISTCAIHPSSTCQTASALPFDLKFVEGSEKLLNTQVNFRSVRYKSSKSTESSEDNNLSDDEAADVADSYSDIEEDYDIPVTFKHKLVHSQRADLIVAKGLGISHSGTEKLFYESKLLYNGKTLLKKGKKIAVGEYIDVVADKVNDKLIVQRVKIIKILDRVTKKGKPVVAIRVWKKPFEVNKSS